MRNLSRKRILVTGHTGFKGSWLIQWLIKHGAEVSGLADQVPTTPAHFDDTACADLLKKDLRIDIADTTAVVDAVRDLQPEVIFHLAAQPLVLASVEDPVLTFRTNVLGTANLLDAVRHRGEPCVVICITSDKCYENQEWLWGYRETDRLGGKDPYSASKACAELVIQSYVRTHFGDPENGVRLGIGRAGNVIGGGDWADNRIVPDCVRAWSKGEPVTCRNPKATRPWQHVLEPLSGYVALASALLESPRLHGEAFNFGPPSGTDFSVGELIEEMTTHWPGASWENAGDPDAVPEAGLLKLDCDKALAHLDWRCTLDWKENIAMTVDWYRDYFKNASTYSVEQFRDLTVRQLDNYEDLARKRGLAWAK